MLTIAISFNRNKGEYWGMKGIQGNSREYRGIQGNTREYKIIQGYIG